jgi:hypothetical protein
MSRTRIAWVVLAGLLGLMIGPTSGMAAAQQQQAQVQQSQSVAEAARKAKEQQKNAPKATTVWTNDSIGNVQGTINVVGKPSAPQAAPTLAGAQPGATGVSTAVVAPEVSEADRAKLQGELDDAKKALAGVKTDLDIAQRKYDLDSAQYYGTPNYAANQQGQVTLNNEKTDIASKKQSVDAAQKKVDDLEKQLKALGPAKNAPANPAPPQS